MGNCGFGIAPTRPEHRETIVRTLENVEGMSAEALSAGISWTFESFGEYLDAVAAQPLRVNAGAMVGHTPLRLYILGEDASERTATAEEIASMGVLLRDALRAGGLGFATSKVAIHNGANGRPVPSRLADEEDLLALMAVLRRSRTGVIEAAGFSFDETVLMARASGRPMCNPGGTPPGAATLREQLDILESHGIWLQIASRPISFQVTMLDPFPMVSIPAFADVLAVHREGRKELYQREAWREAARLGFDEAVTRSPQLSRIYVSETDIHLDLVDGPSIIEVATRRQAHPVDVLLDLALAEDLRTRFRVVFIEQDPAELGAALLDPRTVVGLSDAGAHASQICDAVYATNLLQEWVRERGVLSLEQAVRHLTSHPADVFGLADRGRIVPGAYADLVALDPDRVGWEPLRRVHDLPAGADRLISRGIGIEHVWVNGTPTRLNGADLDPAAGPAPGRVLRGS